MPGESAYRRPGWHFCDLLSSSALLMQTEHCVDRSRMHLFAAPIPQSLGYPQPDEATFAHVCLITQNIGDVAQNQQMNVWCQLALRCSFLSSDIHELPSQLQQSSKLDPKILHTPFGASGYATAGGKEAGLIRVTASSWDVSSLPFPFLSFHFLYILA
jgi:hypothetical protein